MPHCCISPSVRTRILTTHVERELTSYGQRPIETLRLLSTTASLHHCAGQAAPLAYRRRQVTTVSNSSGRHYVTWARQATQQVKRAYHTGPKDEQVPQHLFQRHMKHTTITIKRQFKGPTIIDRTNETSAHQSVYVLKVDELNRGANQQENLT